MSRRPSPDQLGEVLTKEKEAARPSRNIPGGGTHDALRSVFASVREEPDGYTTFFERLKKFDEMRLIT
jgi:hypothetical protein